MIDVTFKTREATAILENGKPVIKYVDGKTRVLVASTKSLNIAHDDLTAQGIVITATNRSDIFLDMSKTRTAILAMCKSQIEDEALSAMVAEHCMKALASACVFWKSADKA